MLTNLLLDKLSAQSLKLDRFQEITSRLLASNIILRDEDGVEQRLYDDARRVEDMLTEVFSMLGFRLVHDLKNEFFRLYAPGAVVPGLDDDGLEAVASLRMKLSPDFVAAALALRFLYQQGLIEGGGRLTDEGEVFIRFEELAATLQTQVKRPLPDTPTERKALLNELRRHRIIHLSPNFVMTDEDALIAIRPTILGLIGDDALAEALDNEEVPPSADADPVNELSETIEEGPAQ